MRPVQKTIEQIKEGTHIAIPFQIIFLGNVPVEFQGKKSISPKVRIGFEFPSETYEYEGKIVPRVLAKEYTFSFSNKGNLIKIIKAILGANVNIETVNLEDILSKPCMTVVTHNEKGYADIGDTVPVPGGFTVPALQHAVKVFDYNENYDEEFMKKLPKFIQDKMTQSLEFKEKFGMEDDIQMGGLDEDDVEYAEGKPF